MDDASFINYGVITDNGTYTSNIEENNGDVFKLNGGTFTIETGTQAITTIPDMCIPFTAVLDEAGQVTVLPFQVFNNEYPDNGCTLDLISVTPDTFDCSLSGTTQDITLLAEDGQGNQLSCVASVLILDNEVPQYITMPDDITSCSAIVDYEEPTFSDNCNATLVSMDPPPGSEFEAGTTEVFLTIQDDHGNTNIQTFYVTYIPVVIEADISVEHNECFGGETGEVQIEMLSGEYSEYEFLWDTGERTPFLKEKPAGIYTVSISDLNVCNTITESVEIEDGNFLTVSDVALEYEGNKEGAVFQYEKRLISVDGGTAPYYFELDKSGHVLVESNEDNDIITVVYASAANWQITFHDSKGCGLGEDGLPVVVKKNPDLTSIGDIITIEDDDIVPAMGEQGVANGFINLTVVGGTGNYDFEWSGKSCPCENSNEISGLATGWYAVTITDDENNQANAWFWLPWLQEEGVDVRAKMTNVENPICHSIKCLSQSGCRCFKH